MDGGRVLDQGPKHLIWRKGRGTCCLRGHRCTWAYGKVYPFRLKVLSAECCRFDPKERVEKVFEPGVVGQDAKENSTTGAKDLAGEVDEEIDKSPELHPNHGLSPAGILHQQPEP